MFSKDITLQVKALSPTGLITECFADRENTIQTAKQEACESMGIWNSVNGTCDIKDAVKAAVVAERERFNALPLNAANVGQTNWVTGEKIIKNIVKRTYKTGNKVDWCRSTGVYKCPAGYSQEGACHAPASHTDIITCVQYSRSTSDAINIDSTCTLGCVSNCGDYADSGGINTNKVYSWQCLPL